MKCGWWSGQRARAHLVGAFDLAAISVLHQKLSCLALSCLINRMEIDEVRQSVNTDLPGGPRDVSFDDIAQLALVQGPDNPRKSDVVPFEDSRSQKGWSSGMSELVPDSTSKP